MNAQPVHVVNAHASTTLPYDRGSSPSLRYIATPYSHPDPEIRQWRADAAGGVVARLAALNILAYSPIAHTHAIAQNHDLPKDFAYWSAFDHAMILRCDIVTIVMFDGWRESHGINAEYDIAQNYGRPVEFVDPWLYNLPASPTLSESYRLSECCAEPRYPDDPALHCPRCGLVSAGGQAIWVNGATPPFFR